MSVTDVLTALSPMLVIGASFAVGVAIYWWEGRK